MKDDRGLGFTDHGGIRFKVFRRRVFSEQMAKAAAAAARGVTKSTTLNPKP